MPAIRTNDSTSDQETTTYGQKDACRRSTRARKCKSYQLLSSRADSVLQCHGHWRPGVVDSSLTSGSRSSGGHISNESVTAFTSRKFSNGTSFTGPIIISGVHLRPTVAFDTFWQFAAERKAIDDRRRAGEPTPWTNDKILQKYFFCNTFRVLDKGCQFLITEVIEKGPQDPEEVVFRVILFNLFTKIETWQLLDAEVGPLTWATYNHEKYAKVLSKAVAKGVPLYTEAYIKPAPHFGYKRNFKNHLCLLEVLMDNKLYSRLLVAPYMADVYEYLYSFPSMGSFTAYQLILNLSYANVLNFHRNDFVVSGPGSVSGLGKIFGKTWNATKNDMTFHQEVMRYFVDKQDYHFKRLNLHFSGLGPEKLPMDIADVEHTLCEVDKYCRVAHPHIKGARQHLTRAFTPRTLSIPKFAALPKAWSHPAREVLRIRETPLRHEKRYEINYISDHRENGDERQYHVYWVGYPESDATWEFENNLLDEAPAAVEDYLTKKGLTHSQKAIIPLI